MAELIIGISGKKGSGKDLLFDELNKLFIEDGLTSLKKLKFAEPIKQMCSILSEQPLENFYDREKYKEPSGINDWNNRELMQKIGTEIFRNFDNDFWVNLCDTKIEKTEKYVAITDLRFKNELELLKDKHREKSFVIRIKSFPTDTLLDDNHQSELDLDDVPGSTWDYSFFNDGKDIVNFRNHVEIIYSKIKARDICNLYY